MVKDCSFITKELLISYRDKGYTIPEVMKELEVSRTAITTRLKKYNISFRKIKFNLKEYLKFKEEGLLDKEIAAKFEMTPHGLQCSKTTLGLAVQKRNRKEVSKEEFEKLYVTEKRSIKEISKILDKSFTAIYSIIKKHKITLRREDGTSLRENKLKSYIDKNKSLSEIAELSNLTEDGVKKALIRHSLDSEPLFDEQGNCLNQFSNIQKQLIYGGLLGDCHLELDEERNVRFKVEHGFGQKEYTLYKLKILNNFVTENSYYEKERYHKYAEKYYKCAGFKTIRSKLFTDLYSPFYCSNKKKYVSKEVLEELTPYGIAIWYMDDGTRNNNYALELCTDDFDDESLRNIQNYFLNTYQIETSITNRRRIHFQEEHALAFQSLISKYILPMFKYKLIDISHQKIAKDRYIKKDLEELNFNPSTIKVTDFIFGKEKLSSEIIAFISKYEWLGSVGNIPKWVFTARYDGKLGGVILVNDPNGFSNLLGKKNEKLEALIQRGCSSSWAPRNLGSWLIMKSLKWMVTNTPKRFFTGYSDPRANEVGFIYQACNFDFLGNNFGAKKAYIHPYFKKGNFFFKQSLDRTSSFKFWCKLFKIDIKDGWFKKNGYKDLTKIPPEIIRAWGVWKKQLLNESFSVEQPSKGKYVLVLGTDKREQKKLNSLKTYKTFEYPKT